MPQNIIYSNNISETLKLVLKNVEYSSSVILCDTNTERYCLPLLKLNIKTIVISEGESNKNLKTATLIWNKMDDSGMDRNSCLINLGGGMVSDIGGFCAATYKRGIDFINIPTTLLAQTDASIGGKVGINLEKKKNHIGVFKESRHVIVDGAFLKTLPERQLLSGYAEMLKHAIIKGGSFWNELEFEKLKSDIKLDLIKSSAKLKLEISNQDIGETGIRKVLNLGHSIGHIIESYGIENKNRFRFHGEAISEGIIVESIISNILGKLLNTDLERIIDKISYDFNIETINKNLKSYIIKNLIHDKKNISGNILMSLPVEIGKVTHDIVVNLNIVEKAIEKFNSVISNKY